MYSESNFALGGLAILAVWLFVGLPLFYHPIEAETFLGLGAHGWIAIWTMALTFVTLFLVLAGLKTIESGREEARMNRTLIAVERYDYDPILDACLRRLRQARLNNQPVDKTDAVTVLNLLESIAIGVEKGLYDEDLAKEHMRHILLRTYERYLGGPTGPIVAEIGPENYIPLRRLYTKWSRV